MTRSERGGADGLREGDRIGSAVAFYHDPAQSDHARPVIAARVEAARHATQHPAGGKSREAIEPGGVEFTAHARGDQRRHALHGLQRHIAGESVGHHHIDVAGEDVVALDEPDVVQAAREQQRMGGLHALVTLDVLLADVQKPDAR